MLGNTLGTWVASWEIDGNTWGTQNLTPVCMYVRMYVYMQLKIKGSGLVQNGGSH
jgi:hypothetical protein